MDMRYICCLHRCRVLECLRESSVLLDLLPVQIPVADLALPSICATYVSTDWQTFTIFALSSPRFSML
jgi:hypothetical protein